MNVPADELDSKYYRLQPDVYYRCPTSDSLDGALRNEIERSSQSLIPVEVCTEFVLAADSTVTILPSQQPDLDGVGIEASELPQLATVDRLLCRGVEGKDRLKAQRAIAQCFVESIQAIDGFRYAERQAFNRDGSDGVRFKYVCSDSLQNRNRKSNVKKWKGELDNGDEGAKREKFKQILPTYDCGGALHIKFSTKREAINIIYKHNPIHRDVESRSAEGQNDDPNCLPALQEVSTEPNRQGTTQQDENRDGGGIDAELDISTSPEMNKTPIMKNRRKSALEVAPSLKKQTKSKQLQSPSKSRSSKKASILEAAASPARSIKDKACVRCRENKISCDETKPTCNQCRRGLWACQYKDAPIKKRSKRGCMNCRRRKRKCTEEHPSCTYCVKIGDDCKYADDHRRLDSILPSRSDMSA